MRAKGFMVLGFTISVSLIFNQWAQSLRICRYWYPHRYVNPIALDRYVQQGKHRIVHWSSSSGSAGNIMQVVHILMAVVPNNHLFIARVCILAYVWSYIRLFLCRGDEKCEPFIFRVYTGMVWPQFVFSIPWKRRLCELSGICRYWGVVDTFDSLFDGDSGPASMESKVMDHGADESSGLKCLG